MNTSIVSKEQIRTWLVAKVADLTGIAAIQIDLDAPIVRFGLDSVAMTSIYFELEEWLDIRLDPDVLEGMTLAHLIDRTHVATQTAAA